MSETYLIEDDVPVPVSPNRAHGGGRKPIYPWRELEVGQSFFAPGKTPGNLSSSWNNPSIKALGRTFTAEARVERGKVGVRAWRTA